VESLAILAVVLVSVHLSAAVLARSVTRRSEMLDSLGGGIAVSYVFLQLFPELELGHRVLGHTIHLIALVGLVVYYGLTRWLEGRFAATGSGTFAATLTFHASYNWLVVYSLPDELRKGPATVLLFGMALALHLVSIDLSMARRFPRAFSRWGRWVLAGAVVSGWLTDLYWPAVDPWIAGTLTALLAGWSLSNVFANEAPRRGRGCFPWFVGGTFSYGLLSWVL